MTIYFGIASEYEARLKISLRSTLRRPLRFRSRPDSDNTRSEVDFRMFYQMNNVRGNRLRNKFHLFIAYINK